MKRIISLFNGIGCAQQACKEVGLKYDQFISFEIDKNAIKINKKNHLDCFENGDVTKASGNFMEDVFILFGGSPCQSFSKTVTGNNGFDGKSGLFWEYVRIKNQCNPVFFFFENVMMKQEWQDIITGALGVKPIYVNSGYHSAQNRERLYWTNIPYDEGFKNHDVLDDVLQDCTEIDQKYYYNQDHQFHGAQSQPIATLNISGHDILKRVMNPLFKCHTLTAVCGGNQHKKVLINSRVRKLTPIEYERLMGLPDNYTEGVSDSARYKAIGNAWEVNTIKRFLKNINP